MQLESIIEALLVASERPLTSSELARLIRGRVAEAETELQTEHSPLGFENDTDSSPAALPVSQIQLSELASVSSVDINSAIEELNTSYKEQQRAFSILPSVQGWQIHTLPEYAEFVHQLFPKNKPQKISEPAMETLSIIAYRQPITKAAVEAVRGVSCDGMVHKLLSLKLIRVNGRSELPGRPQLFSTTDFFLQHFGIQSLDELPNASELRSTPSTPSEDETTENTPPKKG